MTLSSSRILLLFLISSYFFKIHSRLSLLAAPASPSRPLGRTTSSVRSGLNRKYVYRLLVPRRTKYSIRFPPISSAGKNPRAVARGVWILTLRQWRRGESALYVFRRRASELTFAKAGR